MSKRSDRLGDRLRQNRTAFLAAGAIFGLIAGGTTWTIAASSNEQAVNVCVGKRNTVVSAKANGRCPKHSERVRINQTGPTGAPGATGPNGGQGAPGATGGTGAKGDKGDPAPTLAGLVDQAIADFGRLEGDAQGVHPYAWMAQTVAIRRGWHDPLVATYLNKVYQRQHADGGYGLPEPWDAGGDGSVNPISTKYAITLSDHVGPVLLAGWKAGVVPRARVQEVIDMLEDFPAATVDDRCVAYSDQPADAGWCVGNINSSAADFLTTASEAGFDVDLSRVPGILAYDKSTLIDGEWWPYMTGDPRRQDWQHNATMVQAFMKLDPAVGRATLNAMRRATTADPFERAALLRLAEFDCSLADPSILQAALQQHAGDAHYIGLLAYEGAVALDACK